MSAYLIEIVPTGLGSFDVKTGGDVWECNRDLPADEARKMALQIKADWKKINGGRVIIRNSAKIEISPESTNDEKNGRIGIFWN